MYPKDQKIETLDNQNSQQNENQRLPLKDDNIQQTNVSKKDIRPDENQMKNGESDSAEWTGLNPNINAERL